MSFFYLFIWLFDYYYGRISESVVTVSYIKITSVSFFLLIVLFIIFYL